MKKEIVVTFRLPEDSVKLEEFENLPELLDELTIFEDLLNDQNLDLFFIRAHFKKHIKRYID